MGTKRNGAAKILAQCEEIPVVCGDGDRWSDGYVTERVCCILAGDLAEFVFANPEEIFQVSQMRCSDEEDKSDSYCVYSDRFMVALNWDTDPSEATFHFAQRVKFDPHWMWNPNTHAELPFGGRKLARTVCFALKRLGLPPLCWKVVLGLCELQTFAANGFYASGQQPGDKVDDLLALDDEVLLSVESIKPQGSTFEGVEGRNVWSPNPLVASSRTKRKLERADVPIKRRKLADEEARA